MTLEACLASLERQSYSNFEVLIVDSTPDNQSCGIIARGFEHCRYYHHPERLGAHAARNLAAPMTTGDVLTFLDPDMTAAPDWLEILRQSFENGRRAVVCGGVDCDSGYW